MTKQEEKKLYINRSISTTRVTSMKQISIVYINTERTWRGGERQSFLLACEMRRRGHRVWVACRHGFPLAKRCNEAGLPVFPIAPWIEAGLFTAWRLRRFLLQECVNVVQAETGHAVGLGALALLLGTPLSRVKFIGARRLEFPIKTHLLSQWKYSRLDRLVAISRRVKEVVQKGGVPISKISLIHDGIDSSEYPDTKDRLRFRKERGFSESDLLVVHAGALSPEKDQSTLIFSAKQVCQEHPMARFLFLGDGPLRGELTALVKELGLEQKVLFFGHRSDVLEWIAMADIFVLSSKKEAAGSVLLDALVLGIPTAATAAGGIPDFYGSDNAPELSAVGNPAALAENILRVLNDSSESRRRITRGKALATHFTLEIMADKYETLYEKILL